jgi:hypothetical protein
MNHGFATIVALTCLACGAACSGTTQDVDGSNVPAHAAPPPTHNPNGGAGGHGTGEVQTDPTPAPSASAPPSGAPGVAKCPAFGVTAFLCDSFDPAMSPAWMQIIEGGELHAWTKSAASGTHSLESAFDPLPAGLGRATIAYDAPFASAPKPTSIALQFSVQLPVDGYPTTLGLGGLRVAGGDAALSVELVNAGKRLAIVDRLTGAGGAGATHDLGAMQLGAWTCVELEVDANGAFRAWLGKTLATSGTLGGGAAAFASIGLAEVGLTYSAGAANDSIVAFYDDVVVAPAAVGCLH